MAPHSHMPRTSYPERPYDRTAPYDWAIEGILDEEKAQVVLPSRLSAMKDVVAIMGAVVLTTLAITGAIYEAKSVLASDAQDVPTKLPPAVKRKAASAVKVGYNYNLPIGGEGSGVKIGSDVVLTAGHVVLESNPDNKLNCEGSYTLNVNTRGVDWADQVINRKAILNDSSDIALLRVRQDPAFNALPAARIAANRPADGEPVFFINYEGGGSKHLSDRYPNADLSESLVSAGGTEEFYGHPAEYAGTVLGTDGAYLLVATGQVGYGPKAGEERNSHPGASGGPVFNRAGKIIGETIELGGTMSVSDISQVYGVNLSPHPSNRPLSIIQPITKAIVKPLIAHLPERPVC